MKEIDDFIEWAKNSNWKIELSSEKKRFTNEIMQRYSSIPVEYKSFYKLINICINQSDTNWFLSENDFLAIDGEGFAWNTFEKMSISAADGDYALIKQIEEYWNCHLPIMMCVGGEYEYYAINVITGTVVNGFEPEFEESSQVADSFLSFLSKIIIGEIKV